MNQSEKRIDEVDVAMIKTGNARRKIMRGSASGRYPQNAKLRRCMRALTIPRTLEMMLVSHYEPNFEGQAKRLVASPSCYRELSCLLKGNVGMLDCLASKRC